MFIETFQRDVDFEQYSQSRYLDLKTGEIIWVFDEDGFLYFNESKENTINKLKDILRTFYD
jgi:hypothetical protein